MPLGVLPFPSYETVTSSMEPGSSLVLFTDGLIERPGELIDDGMAELAARVQRGARRSGGGSATTCSGRSCRAEALRTTSRSSLLRNLPVTDRFRVEFKAEPEALSQMRSLLRRWLRHAGADDRTIAEVATAAGEAATNAIEHSGAAANFELERPARRRRDRDHRPRPGPLAAAARGRSGPRPVVDARVDGYG